MKKISIVVLLLGVFLLPAFAQEVMVTYMEGDVMLKDKGSWDDIYSGDTLSGTDVIRVSSDSVAEMEAAGRKIVISKAGIYSIGELLDNSRKSDSFGDSSLLTKFITNPNKAATKTAVMGVRGAKTETNSVEWLTEDNMDLSDAKEMIKTGKYKEAVNTLLTGRDDAFDEELPKYDFYLGKSYYLMGEPGKALSALLLVAGDPSAEFYPDFAVMKGNLLLDSFNYNEALTVFNRYLKHDGVSETAQMVTFLSARAYNAMGEKNKAKETLKKAISINPSTDVGKNAKSILNSF